METDQTTAKPSIYLLGIISCLSPFGIVVIVPIIPMIGIIFDQRPENLQYLASAYLLGLAFGQPFAGFLSDKYGRRPLLILGFLIFILSCLGLAITSSFEIMVFLRFIQAAGASVGSVTARAIARDLFAEEKAVQAFSFMSAAMGIAPIIAPVVGGSVAHIFGYQGVYLVTAIVGILILYRSWFLIPETRPSAKQGHQVETNFSKIPVIISSPAFLGYTGIFGFTQGTFFSFLGIGAAIFNDNFGIGPLGFGIIWGSLAIFYVLGSITVNRSAKHLGRKKVTGYSVYASLCVGWLGVLGLKIFGINFFTILTPLAGLMFFSGMLIPMAMFGAVDLFPEVSGTASGVSSSVGLVTGGVFSILSGNLYIYGYLYIALLSALATLCAVLSWLLVHYSSKETLI